MFRINHQFSMVFLSSPPFLCMVYDVLCISVSCQLVSVGLRCYSCLQSTASHFFAAPNGPFLEDLVRLRHGRPWPVGAWDVHSGDAVATTPGLAGQHGGFFRHVFEYQGVPRNARSFFGITQKKKDMVLESHWLRNSGLSHYSIEAILWSSCKMLFLPMFKDLIAWKMMEHAKHVWAQGWTSSPVLRDDDCLNTSNANSLFWGKGPRRRLLTCYSEQ